MKTIDECMIIIMYVLDKTIRVTNILTFEIRYYIVLMNKFRMSIDLVVITNVQLYILR